MNIIATSSVFKNRNTYKTFYRYTSIKDEYHDLLKLRHWELFVKYKTMQDFNSGVLTFLIVKRIKLEECVYAESIDLLQIFSLSSAVTLCTRDSKIRLWFNCQRAIAGLFTVNSSASWAQCMNCFLPRAQAALDKSFGQVINIITANRWHFRNFCSKLSALWLDASRIALNCLKSFKLEEKNNIYFSPSFLCSTKLTQSLS